MKRESNKLTSVIKKQGGYILSDGTLGIVFLLAYAYDLFQTYGLQTRLHRKIGKALGIKNGSVSAVCACRYENSGVNKLNGAEKSVTLNNLWFNEVSVVLNKMSPDGYCFGQHPDDMMCVGWFKSCKCSKA